MNNIAQCQGIHCHKRPWEKIFHHGHPFNAQDVISEQQDCQFMTQIKKRGEDTEKANRIRKNLFHDNFVLTYFKIIFFFCFVFSDSSVGTHIPKQMRSF